MVGVGIELAVMAGKPLLCSVFRYGVIGRPRRADGVFQPHMEDQLLVPPHAEQLVGIAQWSLPHGGGRRDPAKALVQIPPPQGESQGAGRTARAGQGGDDGFRYAAPILRGLHNINKKD